MDFFPSLTNLQDVLKEIDDDLMDKITRFDSYHCVKKPTIKFHEVERNKFYKIQGIQYCINNKCSRNRTIRLDCKNLEKSLKTTCSEFYLFLPKKYSNIYKKLRRNGKADFFQIISTKPANPCKKIKFNDSKILFFEKIN